MYIRVPFGHAVFMKKHFETSSVISDQVVSKLKKIKTKVPTLYWLPKLHKNPIKQDLWLILVLV